MTTFSTANADILAGLTRTGSRFTDATDTILNASGLTATSAILETTELGSNSGAATIFTDMTINMLDMPGGAGSTLVQQGNVRFVRCNIFGDNAAGNPVFAGGGSITALSQAAVVTFEDCYIDSNTLMVVNSRRWRVAFINTRFSPRIVPQLGAGSPQTALTLTGTRTEGSLVYAGRLVQPLPNSNVLYTPYFDFGSTSTAAGGWNFNLRATGNFHIYNPLTDINYSGRSSHQNTTTVVHSQLYLPRFVNQTNQQEITEDVPIVIPTASNYALVPTTFIPTSVLPTLLTPRTVDFDRTQPIEFRFTAADVDVTTNSTGSFSLSAITNTELKHNLHGFRRFNDNAERLKFNSATSQGTRYVESATAGNFDLNLDSTTATDVSLVPAVYDATTITLARLNAIIAGSAVTNTDEVYAVSELVNSPTQGVNGDFLPWTVSASEYTLNPAVTLIVNSTGTYAEALTRGGTGAVTGGTITVPATMLSVGPSGRSIRCTNAQVNSGVVVDGNFNVLTQLTLDGILQNGNWSAPTLVAAASPSGAVGISNGTLTCSTSNSGIDNVTNAVITSPESTFVGGTFDGATVANGVNRSTTATFNTRVTFLGNNSIRSNTITMGRHSSGADTGTVTLDATIGMTLGEVTPNTVARSYTITTTTGNLGLTGGEYNGASIAIGGNLTSSNPLTMTGGSTSCVNYSSLQSTFTGHSITASGTLTLTGTSSSTGTATWAITGAAAVDDLTSTTLILSASDITASNANFTDGSVTGGINFSSASVIDGTSFSGGLVEFEAGGTFANATVTGAAILNSIRDVGSTFASTLSTALARTTNGAALAFFQAQSRTGIDFTRTNFGTELNVIVPAGADDHFLIMDGVDGSGCTNKITTSGTNTGVLYIIGTTVPVVGSVAPTFGFTIDGVNVQTEPVPVVVVRQDLHWLRLDRL